MMLDTREEYKQKKNTFKIENIDRMCTYGLKSAPTPPHLSRKKYKN